MSRCRNGGHSLYYAINTDFIHRDDRYNGPLARRGAPTLFTLLEQRHGGC